MGLKQPKDVSDYPSYGLDVGIVCEQCDRVAVYTARDILAFFGVRRISTALPLNANLFTCKCGSQRCRSIAVPVGQRPKPHESYGRHLFPMYIIKRSKGD